MNDFLKSRRIYMLFVLPFIVMAISFFGTYVPAVSSLQPFSVKGVINIAFLNDLDKIYVSVIGFFMVMALAYMIFFVNARHKFLSQTTTLPSLIYILLTSGIMVNLGFDYLLISVFIVTIAIERLQAAINNTQINGAIYDFGFWIMLAVAIYPKFILLVLWAICVLFFSGRSTLKDIMALLFGLLTPLLLVAFYYFWDDRFAELPQVFMNSLLIGEFIHTLPEIELIRLGMLLFLLIMALYSIIVHYPVSVVNQRRGILSVVSLLFFLSLTLFVVPGNYYDFMYILALPLSFIYAQYFINNRIAIWGNLMFILLLCACFLTYMI